MAKITKMTRRSLQFCCLAILIVSITAVPITEPKEVLEETKNEPEQPVVPDVENKVQQLPAAIDRIDEDLPTSDKEGVQNEKEDLDTANTFWGGYYRTPSWGWGSRWSGYYPSYRSYGWGARGWNGGYRGWTGNYYWR